MKSIYGFVIEPKGERYNNTVDVKDVKLIVNTEIFNHQYVNREAIVLSTPIINNTDIKKGDTVMIVEAMKTMNHIPSTMNGTINKIVKY